MIAFPLTRLNRIRLAQAFAKVPVVDISIACVVEDQMGVAYVDSLENPSYFMIELDQFFCYLSGNFQNEAGHAFLKNIPHGRFLMAGTDGWDSAVKTVLSADDKLIPVERYMYSSDSLSIAHLDKLASNNPNTPHIKRFDVASASADNPFLSLGAFESVEDFIGRGIGFYMQKDDKVVGVAYSSLVCSNAIEISIIVEPDYYRQGIATALSCQLLKWCIEHHLAPHWDAANEESCKLAEKLGYQPEGKYMAYFYK